MHGREQRAVLGTTRASVGVSPGTCWALRVPSAPVTGCVHTLPVPAHGFGDPLGAFSSLSAPRAPDATRDLIRIQQWHEPPTPPVSAGDMGQCPCEELPGRGEWVTSAANRPDGDTRWDASAEVTTESSGSGTAGAGAVIHPLHGRGCFEPGPPRGDRDRDGDEGWRWQLPSWKIRVLGEPRRRERGCVMNPESRRGEENSWQSSVLRL